MLVYAEEISELELQPRFNLTAGGEPVRYASNRQAAYVADFRYKDTQGAVVVEDVKGMDTPLSALKRAVLEAETGIKVMIVR